MDAEREADNAFALIRNSIAVAALFKGWKSELIDRVAQGAQLRHYPRGANVPTGNASRRQALLVVSGYLEVSQITLHGRRFLLRILGPGQVTGLVRLFGDPLLDHAYFVREQAVIVHFACADYAAALDDDPILWREVTKALMERHIDMLSTVFSQLVVGAPDIRIAATLQRLALLYGVQTGDGLRLRLRLSQDDLADMLCVSRQTVNKELRHLEEAGLTASTYNTITIVDPEGLAKLAASRD